MKAEDLVVGNTYIDSDLKEIFEYAGSSHNGSDVEYNFIGVDNRLEGMDCTKFIVETDISELDQPTKQR